MGQMVQRVRFRYFFRTIFGVDRHLIQRPRGRVSNRIVGSNFTYVNRKDMRLLNYVSTTSFFWSIIVRKLSPRTRSISAMIPRSLRFFR